MYLLYLFPFLWKMEDTYGARRGRIAGMLRFNTVFVTPAEVEAG